MLTKQEIIAEAMRLGVADIGFTDAAPFTSQKEYLLAHQEEYGWTEAVGFSLLAGTDPKHFLPQAKSIIVVLISYFEEAFPSAAAIKSKDFTCSMSPKPLFLQKAKSNCLPSSIK